MVLRKRYALLTSAFLLFAVVVAGDAYAYYSYRVYEAHGGTFHDAEKSPSNTEDDLMCWAAASANVLAWTGWGWPDGEGFSTTDDIFQHYQDHWTDEGGTSAYGWEWWFNGVNQKQGFGGWSQVDVAGGGDFWDPPYTFDNYFAMMLEPDDLAMQAIDTYLHAGYGVTLGISGPGGHMVTVWGYDYDESDNYLGIHITDSDDDKHLESPDDALAYYDVLYDSEDERWYLQSYAGSNNWYINEVQALDRYSQPIPEPSTMLLLGAGLSGIFAMRRKRMNRA